MKCSSTLLFLVVCLFATQSDASKGKKTKSDDDISSPTIEPTVAPTTASPTFKSRLLKNEPHMEMDEGFDFVEFIEQKGADPDGSFGFIEKLFTEEECNKMIDFAKKSDKHETHHAMLDTEYTTVALDEGDLIHLLGEDKLRLLLKEFYDYAGEKVPLASVYIQDMTWTDEGANVLDFHTDEFELGRHGQTMVVLLGGDFEGGQIVYVTRDGQVMPQVPVGGAVIHKTDVLHGVTGLNGHRVTLLLESYASAAVQMTGEILSVHWLWSFLGLRPLYICMRAWNMIMKEVEITAL